MGLRWWPINHTANCLRWGVSPIRVPSRCRGWHGRTGIFTQGWGRAYSCSSDKQGEGGLKGRLLKSLLYCRLFIFLGGGSTRHPSNQPPMLVDLMRVLVPLSDIWSQSIKPLRSLKALRAVSSECLHLLYQTSSLCSCIAEWSVSMFLARHRKVFGQHILQDGRSSLHKSGGLGRWVQGLNCIPCVKNKAPLLHGTPVPPEECDLTRSSVRPDNQTRLTPLHLKAT